MKSFFLFSLGLWIGTASLAEAATGWVIRSSAAGYANAGGVGEVDQFPYNLQPVCVNGYELSGIARFSALYVKPSDEVPVVTSISLSENAMSQTNALRQAAGYRLIWLNGFGVGTEARYNAIWKKTDGAAQRLRLGQTLSEHQNDNTSMEGDGYRISGVSSYTSERRAAACRLVDALRFCAPWSPLSGWWPRYCCSSRRSRPGRRPRAWSTTRSSTAASPTRRSAGRSGPTSGCWRRRSRSGRAPPPYAEPAPGPRWAAATTPR